MIPPDILISDLGALNYPRLCELFAGKRNRPQSEDENKGPLLLIFRGLKPLYCADIKNFEKIKISFSGISRLEEIAKETGYSRIVAVSESALERIFDKAGGRIRHDEDLTKQLAVFLEALSQEIGTTIFFYPKIKKSPFAAMSFSLRKILPKIVPKDAIFLFVVTENDHIWASIAIGFKDRQLFLITTLDAVVPLEDNPRTEELDEMIRKISERFDLPPRYLVVEKSAAESLIARKFSPVQALIFYNRGELKVGGFLAPSKIGWTLLTLGIWLLAKTGIPFKRTEQ